MKVSQRPVPKTSQATPDEDEWFTYCDDEDYKKISRMVAGQQNCPFDPVTPVMAGLGLTT